MNKRIRVLKFIITFVLMLCCLTGCDSETSTTNIKEDNILNIHFIDIGQGDCTLITNNGHSMLIDAGNNNKGTQVQSYLENQGIEQLEYVIGTHPDADHIGGLDVILYKFDCKTVILPDYSKDTKTYDEVVQIMKRKNYSNTLPVVGNEYTLGDAKFTIIAPNNYNYGNNTNDYSVGIVLEFGDNKFVFTGDAEETAEADILENGIDISADVYKAAHHGSKTASSEPFLNAINPKYVVISCGEGNSYGHPHAQLLNNLREKKISVFRTDEQGTIVLQSDGKNITWNCSPSESWQAGEPKGSSSKTQNKTQTKTKYILNIDTKKFHLSTCSIAKDIIEENKEETSLSKEELINNGYSPCGRCNP